MGNAKKLISIISPAYNEEANVYRCYTEVKAALEPLLSIYDYEHIFGDNCSSDGTLQILRGIAASDGRVKILSYSRNWGAEKNSMTLFRHASGDVVIPMLADLQDPPAVIPELIAKWEEGVDMVFGVYTNQSDGFLFKILRKVYYRVVRILSGEEMVDDHSGFGLFARHVVQELNAVDDFSPHIRGILASLGFRRAYVGYERHKRIAGISSYSVGRYLDAAINSIVSYSLVPIRLATIMGVCLSGISFLMAVAYAIIKLLDWGFQAPGATTIVILILFFAGIQLLFLGIIGEYVAAIHGQVRRKPFVVIREKINFNLG